MNHIMLDLETLDNHSHSPIIAVGAQAFNKDGILSAYYTEVDLKGQAPIGADTLRWWLKTNSELLTKLLTGQRMGVEKFLHDFSGWVDLIRNESPEGVIGMWGNASVFDNVILGNAYKKFGIKTPWSYKEDKCYRTIRNIFPDVEMDPFEGTEHDPLDDAIFQVNHLLKIHKQKGFTL